MGFFDDIQASMNRGMASAGRAVDTQKIKVQMSDAMKRRQALAAQLGASLYDATKDNLEFRSGREALYDGIAAVDAERASLQAQLDELDRQAQQASKAATSFACPFCGARMSATDLFCAGCGKPINDIKAAFAAQRQSAAPAAAAVPADGPMCPACGAPVAEGDAFCMSCGHKLGAPSSVE